MLRQGRPKLSLLLKAKHENEKKIESNPFSIARQDSSSEVVINLKSHTEKSRNHEKEFKMSIPFENGQPGPISKTVDHNYGPPKPSFSSF